MTLELKFLLCLNEKYFDFKKALFIYYGFLIAMDTSLWDYE